MTRSPNTGTRRGLWARVGPVAATLVAAGALALLASACSGSSGEGVAQVDSTTTSTKEPTKSADSSGRGKRKRLVAFSACMRANGLPGFPDPDSSGQFPRSRVKFIDLDSPTFKSAWRACRELAPELAPDENEPSPAQRARDLEKLLEFAACMRANGVPKFPDPDADGGIGITGKSGGVDPTSPQFKAAEKACVKLLPGGPPDESPPTETP
jgi:hypothetical protein